MAIYKQESYPESYLLMTLDPVHIGTGGYRLGRVDLSIVREPGTRLPKIPGTSLSGAIRQYAATRYDKRQCAGQKNHCGQPTCPICYTFGSVSGERSFSGVASICDARLLLFPVYSMNGPVWVTSPSALEYCGIPGYSLGENKAKWSGISDKNYINLGWLMIEKEGDLSFDGFPQQIPEQVRQRIVLVSDALFSHVVNSNLEVRTSVSINPETGAAEEGALFTYEAIPRATFLWLDVVVDDYRAAFPSEDRLRKWLGEKGNDFAANEKPDRKDLEIAKWQHRQAQEDLNKYNKTEISWKQPSDVINAGLEWAEFFGIGGMGTRGFGRIRNLGNLHNYENISGHMPEQTRLVESEEHFKEVQP